MIKKILINICIIILFVSCTTKVPKLIYPTKLKPEIEYIEYKDDIEIKKNQNQIILNQVDPVIYSLIGLIVFQSIVILLLCITMWKKTRYFEKRLLNDKNL